MEIKLLQRTIYADGATLPYHWTLLATKRWALDWHPHVKVCRYGLYRNFRVWNSGGLCLALNLPLLGDFSFWRHARPTR